MATYIYETIPEKEGEEPVQFELQQSMKDAPLTKHPETGVPVRRLITGGLGFTGTAKPESGGGQCCSGSCACH
ncbi:zinc ribbon domain-containing protein [Coraliomargarita sp. SDUM461003]|uniref:Zinc ribbon domain-containing protein n=1 Tax=Thalassobacterium maritimum TaxID=3041265 RepID=A0ABU1APR5_9BACT|nr:zinc ribbon domain-containing protein [Coraliomargarita sp. SDUM461003]MDQ8206043.1 zinc ribbon domain-containing protein [Coraliomargarita sp. SDUM461003]